MTPPAAGAPLALTMGEPAGIAGEITLKAWRACRHGGPAFFALADPDELVREARALGLDVPIRTVDSGAEAATVFAEALPVRTLTLAAPVRRGRPDPANGPVVLAAIKRATALVRAGDAGAVVTNPIHKESLYAAGFRHAGHTEYLGELAGPGACPVMMLACEALRVVPVLVHLPLAESIRALSADAIVRAGEVTAEALRYDFDIARPRLAVAALNPHAGEGGHLGGEEAAVIAPAVAALAARGIRARGPFPADTLFHRRARDGYDAVLCMYHDQALIPIKTIDFDGGVNITLGLPFVRTSPDHGTGLDIAGRGVAREANLVAALRLARRLADRRAGADRQRATA